MKTTVSTQENLDDVVFENRNKAYGAYALRKSYPHRVVRATAGGITIVVSLLLVPYVLARLSGEAPPPIVNDPMIGATVLPTIEITKVKPKLQTAPVKKIPAYVAPTPTKEPVPEEPANITPNNPEPATPGIENGTAVVTVPGVVEGNVVAPPAVVVPAGPVDYAQFMPSFEGGMQAMMKFLQSKIKYPNSARRLGIEGTVFVRFVIDTAGKVINVEVIKGIQKDCDTEAARVIALLPNWKAGMQGHTPVAVRMVIPINFKLDK